MRRQRSAKIVATVGPASNSAEKLEALFRAGVDLFRLNFSHGTHDDHRAVYDRIRALEKGVGRPIGIMADLQGPKLRARHLHRQEGAARDRQDRSASISTRSQAM